MKIFVKTLKGTHFEIEVKPEDTVADVKKTIETCQSSDVYPAAQQMLIHQGKVLKDETTLEENKVAEKSFIVIMLSKPMLQELGKQNPQLVQLIQEHQADFLRLINEPVEGEGNILGQLAEATPQTVSVTPEEGEAIDRLEAMGFERALVLEVFFACNKNEELAANYLLDHMHEFDE
ncbi:ubiquitin receptor RAD23c-like [Olea europaea var. sylvestris]|uniref:ubiquitin receptor RAD23c-like n=1 Tax=Olea europaea var. sylvestris TaxID=158386 RepID=UPI000C1CD074|nr:ubiquitin receptor RAD23c-like [Olea europaea var. sylvestris]